MILFNGGTGFGMKKGSNQLLTLIAAFFYLSDCEISDILLFHILLSILDIDAAFWLLTQLATLQVIDALQSMLLCGIHVLYASSIPLTYHIDRHGLSVGRQRFICTSERILAYLYVHVPTLWCRHILVSSQDQSTIFYDVIDSILRVRCKVFIGLINTIKYIISCHTHTVNSSFLRCRKCDN